ncbi:hypothetical protein B566_EDAN004809 [Ephemera danica]|nr:hypothetical protein B566_EDAN004809 [Ephemera danica]
MKLMPASLATALANRVLPQPGGPHSKTPAAELRPRVANSSANLTGACKQHFNLNQVNQCREQKTTTFQCKLTRIAILSSSRTSLSDPTSSQVTPGTVAKPSRLAEG